MVLKKHTTWSKRHMPWSKDTTWLCIMPYIPHNIYQMLYHAILCVDQLYCSQYLSINHRWAFIVVSEQNDSEKCMSTTPTFWIIHVLSKKYIHALNYCILYTKYYKYIQRLLKNNSYAVYACQVRSKQTY